MRDNQHLKNTAEIIMEITAKIMTEIAAEFNIGEIFRRRVGEIADGIAGGDATGPETVTGDELGAPAAGTEQTI